MPKREDGRVPGALRRVRLVPDALRFAADSCLVEWGETHVMCTATVEDGVPPFLRGTGKGWVTAEYGMLPRSSDQRIPREAVRGRLSGRTQEIQRLIGRSLRSVTDLARLGERTVLIDCDVLQADGGTRCAAITGGYVALGRALKRLGREGALAASPLTDAVAAVSVGIVGGSPLLDMNYAEDARADVDMNVVMTGSGRFIEIQGTAERRPFTEPDLSRLLALARKGIRTLLGLQRRALLKK